MRVRGSHRSLIMLDLQEKLQVSHHFLWLVILLLAGASLRLLTCFWGYPFQLHPDEWTIVHSAINMISRNSYEAGVFYRPDHFEIKCCAILFQVISYIKYHVSAITAFPEHKMAFYLIARAYTAFFGVLTIILTYKIFEKISPRAQLYAVALVAFFPIFVQHSALATPDITLTFFVLLISYQSILYLENSSLKYLTFMCVTTGIGITCKYTCAIACIWIGIVICLDCIRMRDYVGILKKGLYSFIVVVGVCFFCAPNLFTNMPQTIKSLRQEARSVHLGADGLGFFGNFNYYLMIFLDTAGYETLIGLLAGVVFCLKKRNPATISFGMGLLFWVCISVLALHWERWGMPIYIFFLLLTAAGLSYLYGLAPKRWLRPVSCILGSIILLNNLLSSLLVVQSSLTTEARVDAIQFCTENGITKENSLSDGYSPFFLAGPKGINLAFDKEGKLAVPEGIKYIIMSSMMYGRFYAEPERFRHQVDMYEEIQKNNELIYQKGGQHYRHSNFGIINSIYALHGLFSYNKNMRSGSIIKIYRIL